MVVERAADGGHVIRIDVPVTVRAARVDEMRRLCELWGPKGMASRLRHLRRYFREQADGVQRGLVADFNGNPIGQLWVRLRHIDPAIEAGLPVVYVHTLVVMPEFRRLGVAEGLVRSASALAWSGDARTFRLAWTGRMRRRGGCMRSGDSSGTTRALTCGATWCSCGGRCSAANHVNSCVEKTLAPG